MVVATTNAVYRVDVGIKGLLARPMNAEIIAVGSEMLTPERIDTNSLLSHRELNALGVEVVTKCVVGDDRDRLADAVRRALSRSEIVIVSGGLGPTEDDVTREAVAQALDRKLVFHADIADAIEQRFINAKRKMAEVNKRQAFVIEGARGASQRSRHGARPVDGGVRLDRHAAARSAARVEGDVRTAMPAASAASCAGAIHPHSVPALCRDAGIRSG